MSNEFLTSLFGAKVASMLPAVIGIILMGAGLIWSAYYVLHLIPTYFRRSEKHFVEEYGSIRIVLLRFFCAIFAFVLGRLIAF